MGEIRAVIFDVGGVLTASPVTRVRTFERDTGLPHLALGPLFTGHDTAWSRFERSELSELDFVPEFEREAEALGHRVDGRQFLRDFFAEAGIREEMVAVVRHLRDGYRLGCITNNVIREDRPEGSWTGTFDLAAMFDVVLESAKVGLRKPDPRIYQLACDQLGVAPAESVFLDDFGVNLKSARALGMTTIRVDETPSAIEELERVLGIPLPRHLG